MSVVADGANGTRNPTESRPLAPSATTDYTVEIPLRW